MKHNHFSDYHPVIVLMFFVSAIVLSIIINHPLFMVISAFSAFCCCIVSSGIKSTLRYAAFCVPLVLLVAIINPLFNHMGNTPFLYINSQPITIEALVYGLSSGCMILSMVFWFTCLHKTLGNYKLTAMFGGIFPSVALIITMVFRFIPYFGRQLKQVTAVQKSLSGTSKNIKYKLKQGGAIMSALLSVSLECSMGTADSMHARGYGLNGRTHYNNWHMTLRDWIAGVFILIGAAFAFLAFVVLDFSYFPGLNTDLTSYEIILLVLYGIFLWMPLIITAWEELRWKILQKRI